MDIQAEKIQLIEWLAALNKPSTIKKLVAIKEKETDWWDEISVEEKSDGLCLTIK
jgi:flagellar motor protein MotB